MSVKLSVSILSANFAKLGEEIDMISGLGADYIHIDVMDGNFVPNITFGSVVISAIRPYSQLPFDVHLMIKDPSNHIESFVEAGADIITIHAESEIHLEKTVKKIKSYGKKVGVSIVPTTNPSVLDYLIEELDLVLIMSVNPGFGGQVFLNSQLRKIDYIRNMIEKRSLQTLIAVDGGVNLNNAKKIIDAGAKILVAGSAVFGAKDISQAIKILKNGDKVL